MPAASQHHGDPVAQAQVRVVAGQGLCGRPSAAPLGLGSAQSRRRVTDDPLVAVPTEREPKSDLNLDVYLSLKTKHAGAICKID